MSRLTLLLFLSLFIRFEMLHAEIKKEVANTIVRVKSGNKISTGFFWNNGSTIVTTLHGIPNRNNITVYVHTKQRWYNARIEKSLAQSDLALLKLVDFNSTYFLSDIFESASVDTKVFTVGYNGNIPNYLDKDFVIGLSQGNYLQDILPETAKNEIRNLRFPSLKAKIIYLKGNLVHGFSGSPIVDFNGRLVGIANGGLENGAAAISWCMPSSYIKELESSMETLPSSSQVMEASILFSGNDEMSNDFFRFKEFTFQKIKTRTFEELSRTANYSASNELGFGYLLKSLDQAGIPYRGFKYDIYTEINTGATIAVPSNLELHEENGRLVAYIQDGVIHIAMERFSNINWTMVEFINELNRLTGKMGPSNGQYSWLPDVNWTYNQYFIRNDGARIHRASFHCFVGNQNPNLGPLKNDYLFRVFADKRDVFLGYYVVMNRSIYIDNNNAIQYLNPNMQAKYIGSA